MNGIWEKYTDTNDVNACDASFQNEVLVTGDDFGLVKLFRFPCLKKGKLKDNYLRDQCWQYGSTKADNLEQGEQVIKTRKFSILGGVLEGLHCGP